METVSICLAFSSAVTCCQHGSGPRGGSAQPPLHTFAPVGNPLIHLSFLGHPFKRNFHNMTSPEQNASAP